MTIIEDVVRIPPTLLAYVYAGTQADVDELNTRLDYPTTSLWYATYIDADTVQINGPIGAFGEYDTAAVNVFELSTMGSIIKVADFTTMALFLAQWELPVPPPPVLSGAGVATVPALTILSPTTVVAVTISPAQADTEFTPDARLVGAAGSLTTGDVTVVSTTRVDVEVTTSLAYLGGAQVLVTASR